MRLDTLAEDELRDPGAVAARLQQTSIPLMAHFRAAMAPTTLRLLDAHTPPQAVSKGLRDALLAEPDRLDLPRVVVEAVE